MRASEGSQQAIDEKRCVGAPTRGVVRKTGACAHKKNMPPLPETQQYQNSRLRPIRALCTQCTTQPCPGRQRRTPPQPKEPAPGDPAPGPIFESWIPEPLPNERHRDSDLQKERTGGAGPLFAVPDRPEAIASGAGSRPRCCHRAMWRRLVLVRVLTSTRERSMARAARFPDGVTRGSHRRPTQARGRMSPLIFTSHSPSRGFVPASRSVTL